MKKIPLILLLGMPVWVAAQTPVIATDNPDIRVFPSDNTQSEIHLSINKTDPNNLILSANTSFSAANDNQGWYYSLDGGMSWYGGDMLPYPSSTSLGDPTTCFDASGNAYIAGLMPGSPTTGYFVQTSSDKGHAWTPQTPGYGPGHSIDKEMEIAVDEMQTSPYVNYYYCAFTDFDASGVIKINQSPGLGAPYSTPITLSTGYGQGANVQAGPNGEVYVAWADYSATGTYPATQMGFSYSSDGGMTFTSNPAAFPYRGIRIARYGDPSYNNTRVNDYPSMAVDKSCGQYRGRIYIAYPEFQAGTSRSIIEVRYSDDHGSTWSTATTVSIPSTRENWLPWIAVDDLTGLVNVAYLAFDGGPTDTISTNTFVAYSTDGGSSWQTVRVSDVAHDTAPINVANGYAGDYIGITSFGGKSYVGWADDRTGKWQAYCSRIDYAISPLVSSQTNLKIDAPTSLTGTRSYQAADQITVADVNPVSIASSSSILFKAGQSIIMDPGFKTDPALTNFTAIITSVPGCTTPGAQFYKSNLPLGGTVNNVITGTQGDKKMYAYPVPSDNYITIGCYNNTSAKNITISDMNGRTVIKTPVSIYNGSQLRNTINISSLPSGTYVYSIDFKDGIYSNKFVKN